MVLGVLLPRSLSVLSIYAQHAYRLEHRYLDVESGVTYTIASTDDIAVLHLIEAVSESHSIDQTRTLNIIVDSVVSTIEFTRLDDVAEAFERPLAGKTISLRLTAPQDYRLRIRYIVSYVRDPLRT